MITIGTALNNIVAHTNLEFLQKTAWDGIYKFESDRPNFFLALAKNEVKRTPTNIVRNSTWRPIEETVHDAIWNSTVEYSFSYVAKYYSSTSC